MHHRKKQLDSLSCSILAACCLFLCGGCQLPGISGLGRASCSDGVSCDAVAINAGFQQTNWTVLDPCDEPMMSIEYGVSDEIIYEPVEQETVPIVQQTSYLMSDEVSEYHEFMVWDTSTVGDVQPSGAIESHPSKAKSSRRRYMRPKPELQYEENEGLLFRGKVLQPVKID
ncbi:hypothetical protein LOC67_02965 [Stieleria sp. JC731]|uniref:hypothetical protein n=1 Tax=Pirellulaceae TaxID=2691357 RepID=UPI001E4EB521|nr:hypothetical protein [Stieleria sp. JC731]MCC9599507.1 hypothetical protein [Stieleria sp. JC731]